MLTTVEGIEDQLSLLSGHGSLCSCPFCTGVGLERIPPAEVDAGVSQAPLSSLPLLHSNVGASDKLFLDFDGHTEDTWGFYSNVITPAFDQDGDVTTFSAGELTAIQEIWARVAEDYAPFNVDVTTVDPGNQRNGATAVIAIGGSYSDWYGSSAGGVAFIGGYYNSSSNVGYVFENNLSSNPKYIAEASSHEAGHLFGLSHQSVWNGSTLVTEYNSGNGSWAPIMGVGYNAVRTTWHNGTTSAGPTITQDDMAILAGSNNGFGYKADDFGATIATASPLPLTGLSVNFSGLIGLANDLDVWSFTTTGGVVNFQLTGAQFGSNLDAVLELRNSSGGTIASDSPSGSQGASLTTSLGAGTYYLVARSLGDYGDVGQYSIIGSLPEPPTTPPTIEFTTATYSAGENDGVTSVINFTRVGDLSFASQVRVSIQGGSATPGSDYLANSFPLILDFAFNESNKTVPITLVADSLIEGTQTISFLVSAVSNALVGSQSSAVLNITDADVATVSFQSASMLVGEDDPAAAIAVVLNTAAGNTLENSASITISSANGSAEGTDYDSAAFPKTITFLAGQGNGAAQPVSFDPASDTLVEGDETVSLAIVGGALLTGSGQTSQVVTITDADNATVLVVTGQAMSEDGGSQPITVRLQTSGGSTLENALNVSLSAAPAAQTETQDATFGSLGTFSFLAGAGNNTSNTSINLVPISDLLVEGTEQVTITLAGSVLSGRLSYAPGEIDILDGDSATVSVISGQSFAEDGGSQAILLQLQTTNESRLENDLVVSLTAAPAAGMEAPDATFGTLGSFTFVSGLGDGAINGSLSFSPISDALLEGSEPATLTPTGNLLNGRVTYVANEIIVTDGDRATVLVVAGQSAAEDGGPQPISVQLQTTGASALENPLPVSVSASASAGTEAADATFGSLGSFSFAAGSGNNSTSSSLQLTPLSDSLVEGPEFAVLTPSGSSLGGQVEYISNELLIVDADSATASFQSAGTVIGEDDPAASIAIVLNTVVGNTLENSASITISAVNGTAENSDYDAAAFAKTVTFVAGQGNGMVQSVTMDPSSDTLIEGEETVTLAIVGGSLLSGSGQSNQLVRIVDADSATVSFQSASTAVGEDDAGATITLVLTTTAGNTLENDAGITITATNGSAENSDYDSAAFPKTILFLAGQGNGAAQLVSFDPASDTLVEGEETVSLSIGGGSLLGGAAQTSHIVRIVDADVATVSFQLAGTVVGEDDPAASIAVVLSTAPGNTLENNASVTVSAANGSAESSDYDSAAFSKTVTFLAGQGNGASQSVGFDPASDTLVEGDETVNLAIVGGALLNGSGQTSQTVTITDADSATVLVVANQTVTEDGGLQPITIRLQTSAGNTLENAVNVSLSAAPSAQTEVQDAGFGLLGSFSFPAGAGNGASNASVGLAPTPDLLVEGNELVVITVTGTTLNGRITYASNDVTIQDADSATVSFQSANSAVDEDGPAAGMLLVLTTSGGNVLENAASVTVSATNGSAESADYDSSSFSKTVTFLAGQGNGGTQSVFFDPTSDALVEGDETVTLAVTGSGLLTVSGLTSSSVRIVDADFATASFQSASVALGEDDAPAQLSIVLSTSPGSTLENDSIITISAINGSAENADYNFSSFPRAVTFSAGQGSGAVQSVVFDPASDTLVEGEETVTLRLAGGAVVPAGSQGEQTVRIIDADLASVSFQSASSFVGEDDAAVSIHLILVTAPGNSLENSANLMVNASNGSAENADYNFGAFPKTITFLAGQGNGATQPISFDPASDTLVEGNETITLALVGGPLLAGGSVTSHDVTIIDADSASISFSQANLVVGEDDVAAAVTVVLTTAAGNTLESDASFTVSAATSSAEDSDFNSASFPRSVIFFAGDGNGAVRAISFDPTADTLVEGDETVMLEIASGPSFILAGQVSQTVTIIDADTASVSFETAETAVLEDSLATTIVVKLSIAEGNTLENDARVTVAAVNGSTENADYNADVVSTTLTFTAGQGFGAAQFVPLDPASDALVEGNETVSLTLGSDWLPVAVGGNLHEVTILDGDRAMVQVLPGQSVAEDGGVQPVVVRLLTADGSALENDLSVVLEASASVGTEAEDAALGVLGSVTFSGGSGDNTDRTLMGLSPKSDSLVEGSEQVRVTPSGGTLFGALHYVASEVTILDGDSASVSFQTAGTILGEDDAAVGIPLVLTTLEGNTLENSATITISAENISAERSDYDANAFPKTVMFAAGQGSGAVEFVALDPAGDALIEGDEAVMLQIAAGLLLTGSGQVAHPVTIDDGPVTTEEDLPVVVELAAGEIGDDPLTYSIVGDPLNGTFVGVPPSLTYMPAADFSGSDSFLVQIDGGAPGSQVVSIEIHVSAVNDAPVFALQDTALHVTDETPAQILANWATGMSGGPATALDELGQRLSFVVDDGGSGLFREPPQIDESGTLTFTPNPNVRGEANITVMLQDDSGTENGGLDRSQPVTFTIVVEKARVWHNAVNEVDVSGDRHVVPDDALSIINFINAFNSSPVPEDNIATGPYFDVTGDGWVSPEDALTVINHINAFGADEEGEPTAPSGFLSLTGSGNLTFEELIALISRDVGSQSRRRN